MATRTSPAARIRAAVTGCPSWHHCLVPELGLEAPPELLPREELMFCLCHCLVSMKV